MAAERTSAAISRSLAPLRDVVASIAAASEGTLPSASDRRKLVRRVRAAGSSALPALLRAFRSAHADQAQWAAWLLQRVGSEERPRVAARLSCMLEDPRLSEEQRARTQALLRSLHGPRDVLVAADALPLEVSALLALEGDLPRPCERTPRRINHRRDQRRAGVDLLERGELVRARAALAQAVAADPDDGEALSYLGVCLLQLNAPEEALAYLERVAQLEPEEALHHWNVAAAAKASDRMCRGYLALERYLALPDGNDGQAVRRREARRYLRAYEKLISSMHPGVALADVLRGEQLFQRALCALSSSRFEQAARGLREVLELLPHHYPSWGNLGAAELALGNHDEAMRCLRRALELKPDYEIARENLRLIETRH